MSVLELTYRSFIDRISEVGKKDALFRLTRNILLSLTAFLAIAFILISAEAVFELSTAARKIIFFGYISAVLSTFTVILLTAYSRIKDPSRSDRVERFARMIGSSFPGIKDNLLNAIQLYNSSGENRKFFSPGLSDGSISQADERARGIDFTRVISFRKNNRLLAWFSASSVVFILLMAVFPSAFLAPANRLINYNYVFTDDHFGIAFEVLPGDIEVSKGDNVEIFARVLFKDPFYRAGNVSFNTAAVTGEGSEISSNTEKLTPENANEFRTSLNNIGGSTVYWFEYRGVKSQKYTISVTSRPVIRSTKLTVYPPAYTRLPSRQVDANEITAITGSRIYIEVESSEELSSSKLIFPEGQALDMELNGKNAVVSLTARGNTSFRVSIAKEFGGQEITNTNAQEYRLRVYPDEYPGISIIEPADDLPVQGMKEVIVRSRVTDDFGFTKLRLAYKLSKSRYGMTDPDFKFVDIPVKNTDATGLEVPYVWSLSKLNLGTEDEVEYYVEVFDNDAVSGPKSSKSEVKKLIYPSLESLMKKTEKDKEDIENTLRSAYEQAMELKSELDEIKEKLEKNPEELGLNDPNKNQQLQNRIENIQNQLSSTRQKLNELMTQLMNNNQVSKETIEKYMELQKMFQQIDSKELRDMLRKLQEAMKNISKEQLQEALRNFQFDEENFKKSIERTMELLQKILNEQKFGELTKKLDEIAKKQEQLKEQTEKTEEKDKEKLNEHSKSQEQIKKEYEDFQKQLKELTENMKKLSSDEISKELEKMLREMQKKQLERKMDESSKNLQNSRKSSSEQQQGEISEELNRMNMQMQDLLAQMLEQENSKLMAKMREILSQLKEISKEQGDLKEQSEDLDRNSSSSEYKKNQAQQQDLSGKLSNSIEDIMSLSQQLGNMGPMLGKLLGEAYNEMNKASEQLGKKQGRSANKSQGNAKESLDKAIQKFESMCKSGNMPGKGSSLSQLLQMLQQMIERQQGLNQQLQGLGMQGNQGKLTQEEMAKMQRLAVEQEALRKGLQQLNEEFKKQQDIDGKKLLGNLDQVQKDMMEVIKDLQDNNISPETRKRQEKILSRMLDFQLSAREKDFEQKRESRPGMNFDRSSPPEVIISRPNIIDGINQDVLDLQKESYIEDYEMLIRKYREKMSRKNR